ncbi:Receptor-like kinase TMK4 [Rhynchospora pubera]|uniref:Receptor-like kinase TMK4 n=1 Tax=Rhynchospora pubera TaxID=906938 RepID=A0AAV8DGH4_9POAL|nr:Receptor-like kinase TMK4 [Rhynchospora pubera]
MGKKSTTFPFPCPFLTLLLLILLPISPSKSDDSDAMSDLAKSLSNLPPSWKPNSDPCNWSGVRCDSKRVSEINLARLSISGSLPTSISSLSSLKSLQLQSNSISGAIPSLSSLGSLQRLTLDSNSFTSLPADFLSGMTNLESLSIDDNPFEPWTLPASLDPAPSALTSFSASNASLSGTFPEVLATLPTLQSLRLSYNNLSGGLPLSLNGSSIQSLQLNNQQSVAKLTGGIEVIASMPQLTLVWLQSNGFTGPIPDLSSLNSLQSFNVRDNQLTGVVPTSLTTLSSLQNISLSNNKLQGPFPSFSSNVVADVDSGNNFCNTLPGPCDSRVTLLLAVAAGFEYPSNFADSWTGNDPCGSNAWLGVTCDSSGKNITVLNFANQKLMGVISPDIANITSLTKLVLSNNNLVGTIPDTLTSLPNLQVLDVSNNNLTGDVPKFAPTVTLKTSGNRFGQSGSGSSSGGGSPGSSSGRSSDSGGSSADGSNSKKSTIGWVIGLVVIVVALVALIIAAAIIRRRNKKNIKKFNPVHSSMDSDTDMVKIQMSSTDTSANVKSNNYGLQGLYSQGSSAGMNLNGHNLFDQGMHMSIESLRNATENFSEANVLGRGGFGVVYKGNLNGMLVAVKRSECDPVSKKGLQEFRAEIDVLTKVRHRNLVALLGYCENGSERLLVYEYMSGGTLGDHLFDQQNSSGHKQLTWMQRLTIALDVARGIEYLHSLAQETFIHRDLKPSNILLDGEMRAKVSDFGLVKLAADREKSVMTRLAGTFGYLAPEYAITGKISTKVDVYAFGVILMEIITGRKVLDDSLPDDESHLVTCFRRNLLDRDRFMKSVDPSLDLSDNESRDALLEMADLARHCTAREHIQRPDMSHCVNRLAPLVDKWRPTSYAEEDEEGDLDSGLELSEKLKKWKSNENTSTADFSTFG